VHSIFGIEGKTKNKKKRVKYEHNTEKENEK